MLIISILFLLFSNSVTLRRDMAIIFNRLAIIALIYCILQDIMSLSFISKGIGLHGGLLYITNLTQIFHIFIFFISILILQLTSFFPKKFLKEEFLIVNPHFVRDYLSRTKILDRNV